MDSLVGEFDLRPLPSFGPHRRAEGRVVNERHDRMRSRPPHCLTERRPQCRFDQACLPVVGSQRGARTHERRRTTVPPLSWVCDARPPADSSSTDRDVLLDAMEPSPKATATRNQNVR